jgi:RNA polymerase sigma-70 factor (ECF subfamily)
MPESSESDPFGAAATTGLELTARLIERAQAGDEEALGRLLARHLPQLRRWARGRLPKWARDIAETDDLIQDTLLQTFKRIEHFEYRGVGALQAYMREAILNRVRDELRKKGRRPIATELDGLEVHHGLSPLEEAIGRESIARYEQRDASQRATTRRPRRCHTR